MADIDDLVVDRARGAVWLLTLNRPAARNALTTPLLARLAATLAAAEDDETVRSVVLTGGPDCFAAGADIGELADKDEAAAAADPRVGHWAAIRRFAKPLIAAVNGWCLGGGNELAMACDIVIAGDNASFGQPEINLAILPGAGGTQLLPRLVGKPLAMKLILSGAPLSAAEALAAGLVAELVPAAETIGRALDLAARIAEKSPLALRLSKQAVLAAYDLPLADGLAFERQGFARLCGSADKREGVAAFREKRKPRFVGR
jgi:enoyl-CoA hydratase